ncbi:hypothetical protein [Variovorax paradoxus]|uniref:hypothetical protein n=1 Tax=Variovorax paradoxus TaxID=34073 RepID=UPI003D6588E0
METLHMFLALGRAKEVARGEEATYDEALDDVSGRQWFRKTAPAGPRSIDAAELASVVEFASRSNRVCPKPVSWSRLYAMLLAGSADRSTSRIPPPPPIHGTEWAITSSAMKKMWLRDHLEWADRASMLGLASSFLREMPESDWFLD